MLSALLLVSAWVPAAQAHNLGADSVDCTIPFDCEIRWEDYTRYDDARQFGIGQWNALGRIDIAPDGPLTITDVEFIDWSDCGVTWDGFWDPRGASDAIGLNPCNVTSTRFPNQDPPDPRAVMVHELGHGLRLAHPSGDNVSAHWEANSIMYTCARCTPTSTYHDHDIGDYRTQW